MIKPSWVRSCVILALCSSVCVGQAPATTHEEVSQRCEEDVAAGRPLVVHVIVALCDNQHQGIVRVPAHLGNGQDPDSNLYWGALYGVRTYLTRKAGWRLVRTLDSPHSAILDKLMLRKKVARGSTTADVYLVAEAWDGKEIKRAIDHFLSVASGRNAEQAAVDEEETIAAGGKAHLVAFVGHNGLMDFSLSAQPHERPEAPPRAAAVLACVSKAYFLEPLGQTGAYPQLLTTGLMAPEAYVLDAAISAWAAGHSPEKVREAAANAYHAHQRCGINGARRLFSAGPPR